MSNAKTSQIIDAAMQQHATEIAKRTGIIIDNAVKNIALLMAKDIAELKFRVAKLERALAPGGVLDNDNDKGSEGNPPS